MSENKPVRIIRAAHEKAYFVFSRKTAQDANLSYEALGVLTYLLSKPDSWQANVRDIAKRSSEYKVYKILRELRKAGYLTLEKESGKGRFSQWVYQVFEACQLSENQQVENQVVEKRHTKILQNDSENTEKKEDTRKSAPTPKRPKDRNKWKQEHLTSYEEEFPEIKRFAALDNPLEPSLSQLTRLTALDCIALFEELQRFPAVDLKKLFDYAAKRDNPKGYNTFKWMLYSLDSFIKHPAQPKEYAAPYHKPIVIEETPDAIPMPQEAKDALQALKDKLYVKDGYHATATD